PAATSGRRRTIKAMRQRIRRLPPPSSLRRPGSGHVDDDGLLVGEMLEHRFERGLLAEPRLLHPAITQIRLHDEVLVDLDEARLEALRRIERRLEIARPDGRGKAEIAVIGLRDRLLIVAEADDAGDRPEDLLARQAALIVGAGENHRLDEEALLQLD